ncbi:hypothetical protein [uncultured Roseobacter sp.]|uniref:hypothetical protein n=1 Tax=uncultured Roseobacter sp. TaxID=114847 RepID=UPI0026127C0E|nr:hypothetical protein [uncultured Roseobacter sp.]
MPRVVRLYVKSALTGFAAAGAFVALVLWLNVANLWHLVSTSDVAIMAVAVFWVLNGIVFSGVQFAWAITAMAARQDSNTGGGGPRPAVPVLVAAQKRKPDR